MSLTPEELKIVEFGKAKGKTQQEVVQALSKYRFSQPTPSTTQPPEQSVVNRVGNVINTAGSNINDAISGTGEYQGQSSTARGFSAGATAANAVLGVGKELLPKPVRSALDWAGEKLGQGFSAVINEISERNLFKELGQLEAQGYINPQTTPEFYKIKDALSVSSSAGQVAGDIMLADQVASAVPKTINIVKNINTKLAPAIEEITSGVGSKVSGIVPTSESIMQRVARIPKGQQAAFESLSGESVGGYLTKRGIYGNIEQIATKLYERFVKSMNTADEALDQLPGTFEPTSVKTALQELLAREQRISSAGAVSRDLNRVSELLKKIQNKGLTMKEINEAKRLFERNIKVDYLKSAASNPEGVAKATNLDSAIRSWQLEQAKTLGMKNLDVINKETQFARQLMDDIGQNYAGTAGNNAVGLTDWIVLSGGNPSAIGSFLIKKVFSSKTIQSKIAEFLNRGKKVMGDVKADIGQSKVPQLPAGDPNMPPTITLPIKALPKSTIEKGKTKSSKPR